MKFRASILSFSWLNSNVILNYYNYSGDRAFFNYSFNLYFHRIFPHFVYFKNTCNKYISINRTISIENIETEPNISKIAKSFSSCRQISLNSIKKLRKMDFFSFPQNSHTLSQIHQQNNKYSSFTHIHTFVSADGHSLSRDLIFHRKISFFCSIFFRFYSRHSLLRDRLD